MAARPPKRYGTGECHGDRCCVATVAFVIAAAAGVGALKLARVLIFPILKFVCMKRGVFRNYTM